LDNSKDLVVAILGAAVALAGLLLVFCGFLYSQADSFPSTTDDTLLDKYRNAAKLGVVPFLGCLAIAALAGAWLRSPSPSLLSVSWYGFLALLVTVGIYGSVVILVRLH
jgi:hypothetical protein